MTVTPLSSIPSTVPEETAGTLFLSPGCNGVNLLIQMTSGTAVYQLLVYDPESAKWWPYGPQLTADSAAPGGRTVARIVAEYATLGGAFHLLKVSGSGTLQSAYLQPARR